MVKRYSVVVPQENINDELATVVEWYKDTGDLIHKNEAIVVVETTKTVFDIEAENEGYLVQLADLGEEIRVGSLVGVLSSKPDDSIEEVKEWVEKRGAKTAKKKREENYTKKALIVAERLNIKIEDVPSQSGKVTENLVLQYHERIKKGGGTADFEGDELVDDTYPDNRLHRLLILGGGDGAVQIADALVGSTKQKVRGILDDNPLLKNKKVMGIPILGPVDIKFAQELYQRKDFDAAVISISTSIDVRKRIFNAWREAGIPFANVLHPTVYVGSNVSLGSGNVLLAFCHIGPCSIIGDNNFLSAFTNIEHHNVLGDNCSFGPGVFFSGIVKMGSDNRLGTGICIEPYLTIGSNCTIASGSVITKNIPSNSLTKSRTNVVTRNKK